MKTIKITNDKKREIMRAAWRFFKKAAGSKAFSFCLKWAWKKIRNQTEYVAVYFNDFLKETAKALSVGVDGTIQGVKRASTIWFPKSVLETFLALLPYPVGFCATPGQLRRNTVRSLNHYRGDIWHRYF